MYVLCKCEREKSRERERGRGSQRESGTSRLVYLSTYKYHNPLQRSEVESVQSSRENTLAILEELRSKTSASEAQFAAQLEEARANAAGKKLVHNLTLTSIKKQLKK